MSCLVILIGTGLRIAADEPSLRWLTILDFVLPRENLWFWHLVGALGFTASFAAYAAYILTARLGQRTRLDGSRLAALWRGGPARWPALNAIVLWVAFGAFTAEIVSGILLFVGQAGWALFVHRHSVWFCLCFPILHVLGHFVQGGGGQLLRIVRPAMLVVPPPPPDVLALLAEHVQLVDDLQQGRETPSESSKPDARVQESVVRPFVAVLAVAVVVVATGFALQRQTGTTLMVPLLGQPGLLNAPVIDGDISDPAWTIARPIHILTGQGANFGSTGQTRIEIKAVRDLDNIYLALVWEDPTRSLKHRPLVKRSDGWHVAITQPSPAGEEIYNEDQFSVLLSVPTAPVVGAAIHLSPNPLLGYPASSTGRGMHYTALDAMADVWLWRAGHGGNAGVVDDAHFGPPVTPTPRQQAGQADYAAGFAPDAVEICFADNFKAANDPPSGWIVTPLRLPANAALTADLMGNIHGSPEISEEPDARWWMTAQESEPYSRRMDETIPLGAVIPSVLMLCVPSGDQADVRGKAVWAADRWTLEITRALDTKSDVDLKIVSGVMMWLAAFDHAATRHTRHVRPIYLELL